MSFTCAQCHVKNTGKLAGDMHGRESWGRCEDCGYQRHTFNCKCATVRAPERRGGLTWDDVFHAIEAHTKLSEQTDAVWALLTERRV